MSAARVFLVAMGLPCVIIGMAYLVAPVSLAAFADLALPSPLAVIEVRGFYGGQLVGLGAFMLLGARRSAFTKPALLLVAAALGGTALGRVVGVVAAGVLPAPILLLFGVEAGCALAALVLSKRA
jgi:hypothetical protein